MNQPPLESAYEECLCFELGNHEIPFARQVPLPIVYKPVKLDCGYCIDIVVDAVISSSLCLCVSVVKLLLRTLAMRAAATRSSAWSEH